MSRILFINSVCNGSTGTICKNLYKAAVEAGHECCIAYGRGEAPKGFHTIKIGNQFDVYSHVLKARLFDAMGFGSKHATKVFINQIEEFKPDIIHMHNIHGYYINIEILFNYLKKHPEIKKIWTLHDCWAFTGHCPHYEYENCYQWKTECKKCVRRDGYPKALIDRCRYNYLLKKQLFTGVENMKLVTPSQWLKNEVEQSYLKNYETIVINNGIDTNIFKPTISNIKEKYGIQDKKVILGVASVWDDRKGLNIFVDLSKQLDSDYLIILIGLNNKQIKKMPANILGINRTENVEELVKWYNSAEVFFNASFEETFGMTTIESLYCHTPVIVFDKTALPEIVGNNGIIIKQNQLNDFYRIVNEVIPTLKIVDNIDYSIEKFNFKYIQEYKGEVY